MIKTWKDAVEECIKCDIKCYMTHLWCITEFELQKNRTMSVWDQTL